MSQTYRPYIRIIREQEASCSLILPHIDITRQQKLNMEIQKAPGIVAKNNLINVYHWTVLTD
jgi:hypothetical protein